MPTYAYACTTCDHRFEAQQSFTDDALTDCPECSGRLRKLFNSVGIVFKGSGFYRTDSRASAPGSSESTRNGSDAGSKGSSTTDAATSSGAKSDAKSTGGSKSDGPSNGGSSSKTGKVATPAGSAA